MAGTDQDVEFPIALPPVTISVNHERLAPIDCKELQWWFVIPEVGQV